jgi:GR25 family glycosyltransferase involved in LPS biosynthesis
MIKCKIIQVSNSQIPKYVKRDLLIKNFLSEYSNIHFDFFISEAITPNDLEIHDEEVISVDLKFPINKRTPPSHTHGFCNFLSHYKIWKERNPYLILEDDLVMDKSVFDRLPSIIEKFNKIQFENKLLYLQSSCPWRTNYPLKYYDSLIDFSDDFWLLPNTCSDVSGTAAYYINVTDGLLDVLSMEIGATDGILHNRLRENSIMFFIPKDFQNWFLLNKDVQ